MTFDMNFLMVTLSAVFLLGLGFGQGLTLNVKGETFVCGLRLSVAEAIMLTVFLVIFVRSISFTLIADGFLIAGTLIGLVMTRHERPRQDQRELTRPGYMPGCRVNRLV